eukprot:jgi/Galph1/4251/GphlegSOOS_G2909.1
MQRGAFIVFEGLDKSGKTTQIKNCLDKLRLEGYQVCGVSFPDRTTHIGHLIDAFLREKCTLDDRAVHLLFSANRWEKWKEIQELLLSGITVLIDRYSYSGVTYTASKGYDLQWCKEPETGLIAPDLVIYLNISSFSLSNRAGYGEERYERVDFQNRVSNIFESLKTEKWLSVDGNRSMDVVTNDIMNALRKTIRKCSQEPSPLGVLWKDA